MPIRFRVIALAAAAMAAVSPALAQQAPIVVGRVSTLDGPQGSVLVLRGDETFALQGGDDILEGDKVFTRTDGAVVITSPGCDISLGGQSSIDVTATGICRAPIASLAPSDVIGGVEIGIAGGGGIGATPILLGLAAAGGGLAAAGGGGGDNSPASP